MLKAGEISAIPAVIELLQGENVRKGFLAPLEFVSLSEKIPDTDVRELVAFLYNAGWRSGEGKTLEWSEVDLSHDSPTSREVEVKEVAASHNWRATGSHPKTLRGPAPGMSLCVSSLGQADCLVQESIQGGCC